MSAGIVESVSICGSCGCVSCGSGCCSVGMWDGNIGLKCCSGGCSCRSPVGRVRLLSVAWSYRVV